MASAVVVSETNVFTAVTGVLAAGTTIGVAGAAEYFVAAGTRGATGATGATGTGRGSTGAAWATAANGVAAIGVTALATP